MDHPFIKYNHPHKKDPPEMRRNSVEYYNWISTRRSVRDFSEKPVEKEVIENILMSASTAPSGANKQPWTFCAVSNPDLKQRIRVAAEEEEYENYHGRMSEEWLRDLAPLGTGEIKEFLTIAPWLIVVFKKAYDLEGHEKRKNYYVSESVGIACGILLTAIHHAGLVALTHTPSPMNFLKKILNRPENESPYLLIPVGYGADEAMVPDIKRKKLDEIAVFYV